LKVSQDQTITGNALLGIFIVIRKMGDRIYYAIGLSLYGAACAFLIFTTIYKHFFKDPNKETGTLAKGVRQIFRTYIYLFFAGNFKAEDF
jgi:O-antigen/teichoic acid export membrane protein